MKVIDTKNKNPLEIAAKNYYQNFADEDYKYQAFISYRHLKPDSEIAKAIHTMIETFPVPKEFYINGKKPEFRVFRDREELSTASLSDSLDGALKSSKFLIVICSKQTPFSEWCNIEVETFLKLRGPDRIIPVLIEGEPWESLPHPLRSIRQDVIDESGQIVQMNYEHLAADLRPEEVLSPDFPGYKDLEKENPRKLTELTKKSLALLKEEKFRIMAGMLGLSYGDLKQRGKERRQRQILTGSIVLTGFLMFFGAFMFNAYKNEAEAKVIANQNSASVLLKTSRDELNRGDPVKAMLVADLAMKNIDESYQRYEDLKYEHIGILNDAISPSTMSPISIISTNNSYGFASFSKDGSMIGAGLGMNKIGIWDSSTGSLIKELEGHEDQVKISNFSDDSKNLISGGFDGKIIIWDVEKGEKKKEINTSGNVMALNYTGSGNIMAIILEPYGEIFLSMYDKDGNDINVRQVMPPSSSYFYSSKGTDNILISTNLGRDGLRLYDPIKGELIHSFVKEDGNGYEKGILTPDGKAIFAFDGKSIEKFDANTFESLFKTETDLFSFDLELIKPSFDSENLLVGGSNYINLYDGKTGDLIENYSVNGLVKSFDISEEGEIISLQDDQTFARISNGMVKETRVDAPELKPEYVFISQDGKKLIQQSLVDKSFAIINLASDESIDNFLIPGSLDGQSENRKYGLISDESTGELSIMDLLSREIVHKVPWSDHLGLNTYNSDNLALSNDGETVFYMALTEDSQPVLIKSNFKNSSKEEFLYPKDTNNAVSLSKDGKTLYIASTMEIKVCDSESGEVKFKIEIPRGFNKSIKLSVNESFMAINFSEGNSALVNLQSKEITPLPGMVIYIDDTADDILVKGVNNTEGFIWTEENGLQTNPLNQERQAIGDYINDLEIYDERSDLLLSIRNETIETNPSAYVTNFSSGALIKSFDLYRTLPAGGAFLEDGSVIADYDTISVENEEADFGLDIFPRIRVYPIKSYEDLIKEKDQILEDRSLSEEDLNNLGL